MKSLRLDVLIGTQSQGVSEGVVEGSIGHTQLTPQSVDRQAIGQIGGDQVPPLGHQIVTSGRSRARPVPGGHARRDHLLQAIDDGIEYASSIKALGRRRLVALGLAKDPVQAPNELPTKGLDQRQVEFCIPSSLMNLTLSLKPSEKYLH